MIRRPTRSTRTATPCPYTPLFRAPESGSERTHRARPRPCSDRRDPGLPHPPPRTLSAAIPFGHVVWENGAPVPYSHPWAPAKAGAQGWVPAFAGTRARWYVFEGDDRRLGPGFNTPPTPLSVRNV